MTVLANKKNGAAILHFVANATTVVVGNNSVSNVAILDEYVAGGTIRKVWFGAGNSGYWAVKRGANTVLVLGGDGSGFIDFAGEGAALSIDKAANVVVELNGTTFGFIMLEVQKTGNTGQPGSTQY